MQIKKFILVTFLLLLSINFQVLLAKETNQDEKNTALFATIGQPIGVVLLTPPDLTLLTTKLGLGMTLSKEFVLYGDLIFLPPSVSQIKDTQIGEMYFTYNFNMGVGFRFSTDKKQCLGIRFPLFFNWGNHIEYKHKKTPFLIYEIAPVLILLDDIKIILDGYIGFHIPF